MIILSFTQQQVKIPQGEGASRAHTQRRGPGTELTKLLAKLGFKETPGCKCKSRAAEMDRRGVDWCETNLETIVGWLAEEAKARSLPFLPAAGRLLVKRAIKKSRQKAKFQTACGQSLNANDPRQIQGSLAKDEHSREGKSIRMGDPGSR